MQRGAVTVVGGAGFVGSAIARGATASGRPVVSVDRVRQLPPRLPASVEQRMVDLLVDPIEMPPGPVVLAAGASDPHAGDPWRLVLDNAVTTARLLPALVEPARGAGLLGRGARPGRRRAAGRRCDRLADWCGALLEVAGRPCPPWQVAGLCRELVAADPTGRWAYALSKRAQELLVRSVVEPDRLTVLRAANLFGPGQDRVVAQLTRRALAGLPLAVTDTVRTFLPVDDLAAVVLDAEPGHARRRAGRAAADRAGRAGAGHARRRRAGDGRPAADGWTCPAGSTPPSSGAGSGSLTGRAAARPGAAVVRGRARRRPAARVLAPAAGGAAAAAAPAGPGRRQDPGLPGDRQRQGRARGRPS